MKTEIVKEESPCRVIVSVEAGADDVANVRKSVLGAYVKRVRLPGFRPGKVPVERIKALYGKEIESAFNEQLVAAMIRTARQGLEEQGREAVRVVDIKDFTVKQTAGTTLTIDVAPTVELPEITKWQVRKVDASVTDEQLATRLEDVRRMASSFKNAEEGETAAEEDLAEIAFTSNLSKEGLSDAAAHYVNDEGYWLQLRADGFIPGLAEALRGKKVGEQFGFDVTFPADFQITDLAGKAVHYDITLKTLRKFTLADDAMVIERFGLKSMDEVRDNVRESLKVSREYEEGQRALADVVKAIDDSVSFELPQSQVDTWTYDELASEPSNPLERFKDDVEGLRKDPLYAEAEKRAATRLRRSYTLLAVAKARDIKLSPEETFEALDSLAQRVGMNRKQLIQRLTDNGRLEQMLNETLCQKVLNGLVTECAVL